VGALKTKLRMVLEYRDQKAWARARGGWAGGSEKVMVGWGCRRGARHPHLEAQSRVSVVQQGQ